ncbi:hypothetical protein EPO14_02075 [Patescibacteria group bacterium]|nr:MAG: hypothetical protein EPO14_02075 [Patescibacteria group bacterium]
MSESLERAKLSMRPIKRRVSVTEAGKVHNITVKREGVGIIKPEEGMFHQFLFRVSDKWQKYSVLINAELDQSLSPVFRNRDLLTIRIDSGCETGQVFGDRTCDCKDQLHKTMEDIQAKGEGMIVHIPQQDGRGKGLAFKLATLLLQHDLGLDTVDAAHSLTHGEIDVRSYRGVIAILKFFNIPTSTKIELATNNPKKMQVFAENGYTIHEVMPVVIQPTELTEPHLRAKQDKLGHLNLV